VVCEVRNSRELLEDDERSGRPSTSRTVEIVKKICKCPTLVLTKK